MKKLFLLTCALVAMTASATEYNYDWASTSGAKAIYYKLNYPVSGEATVVAGEWEYRDDVVIPDEITVGGNTYLVTTIGYHAFYYCSDVSSVTLGANVKTIQSYAFERVSGPNSTGMVININSDALTTIGYTPAKGAKYADGTTAGDPAAAFHVVTIGPNKGKDTLAIGKNVAGLSGRNNYFSWVTFKNVKHYYVDPTSETLSVDADGVLYNANKSKLYLHPQPYLHKTFEIPTSVHYVASFAFYSMGGSIKTENGKKDTLYLREITGGENVEQMGSVISGTYLKTLHIGKNVTTMSDNAMMYVGSYFLPTIDPANPIFKMLDGDSIMYRIATPDTILCQYFKIRKNPTFVVPSYVTQIASMGFYSVNTNLDVIDFVNCNREKLSSIAGDAFLSTKDNLKFSHAENVFDVDEYGVIYTDGFESVRLYASDITTETYNMPEATTSLPRNVIKANGFVKDFNINKKCKTINTEHLDEMTYLERYSVHAQNPNYSSDDEGVLYNKDKTKLLSYPRGNERLFYKVADGTTQIGVRAFYRNWYLVGLDLGDKMEKINEGNNANLAKMQKLKFMRVGVAQPPKVIAGTFSSEMYTQNTILYVPKEHFDIYIKASIWNRFAVVKDTGQFMSDMMDTKQEYYVCHYKENLAGDDWDVEQVTTEGYLLSPTAAEPRTYEGFVQTIPYEQVILDRLGIEVPIYYNRRSFNITWKNGNETVSSGNFKYGTIITPPTISLTIPSGHHFVGWNHSSDATTSEEFNGYSKLRYDTVFYAIFAANDEKQYTIKHYKENIDGSWPTEDNPSATTYGYGAYGGQTQAVPNTYDGFTADPNFNQPTINEDGSTVVTIQYYRNIHNLTWEADGGDLGGNYTSGAIKYGTPITEPTNCLRTGYDFKGWKLSKEASAYENIPESMPDADLKYYAIWDLHPYPIRWDHNNGTGDYGTSYNFYNEQIRVADSRPSKENWHFIGWATTKNGTPITDGNYGIRGTSELVTFYAQYEKDSYQLTWDVNTTDPVEIIDAGTNGMVEYGTAPLLPANIKRTGYNLKGWALSPDATSPTNVQHAMPAQNLTYYAVWEINTHKLAWDANGGELATEGTNGDNVVYGTPITSATTKTRVGYTFKGWSTVVNGSLVDVAETMPDNDLTYYAVWQKNVHQLTWNANGGYFVNGNTSGQYEYGAEITPPQVDRDGWKCAGWGLTPDATPDAVVAPYTIMPDEDLTYYTIWITRDDNIVTWKMNDGTDFNYTATNVTTNAVITAPAGEPARDHYQFIGWAAAPDGEVLTDLGKMDSNKKTFYAQWTLNTHKLAWDANGGEIVTAGTNGDNVAYGTPIKEATAERTGFSFVGWATSADATENDVVRITAMPDEDVTYYAIWATNTYDITWMFNNGTSESFAVTHVPYEGKILPPNANPSREHYEFAGWSATPEGNVIDDFGVLMTPGAIYYAMWQVRTYTLGWDANGGQLSGDYTQPGEVAYGTQIVVPTVALANHIHAGWGTSVKPDSLVNITTMPDSSVTYVAMWVSEQYAIEWRLNDGTENNYTATTVEQGNPIIAPENDPERAHYQFLGWSDSADGDVITEFGTMNSNHMVFYAQWLINSHTLAWNATGGELSGDYTEGSVAVETEIVKPIATRTGYTYNGWNTYADAVDSINITTMPDNDIEYFAIWKVNNHSITWKMNNETDSVFATTNLNYGDTIKALPAMPERDDYLFSGWAATADGNAIDSLGLMPDSDITYYAVWRIAQKSVDWMFSADSIYQSTLVNIGEAITAPAENPVRRNYTFTGWAADINAGSVIDDFGVMPETDTAFYAVWEAVLFDALWAVNDGTQAVFATTQASVSTTLVAPDSIPLRTNYTFKGWSETADGAPLSSMVEMPEGGITLYAVWAPNEFTAIWKMNDGTDNNYETVKVEMGQAITAPTKNPIRQYYDFVGWSKTAQGTVITDYGTMTANGAEFFAIWDAIVEFTAPESFVTCEREQKIKLSGLSNNEIKFSWNVNGKVDATQTGATFDIPDDAAFSGTITVTGSFGGKEVAKSITYQRKKMMTRPMWDDVITVSNFDSVQFTAFRWYHNGTLVDTTEFYNEEGGLTGKYYLIATTEDGTEVCSCESDFGAAPEATMAVYPNPTVEDITVAGSLIETGATISVIDGNGKEWLRKTVETDGSETIRVSQMPQGMYIVKVGDKVVSFIKL